MTCRRLAAGIRVRVDFLEQLEDGGGRELHAGQVVEPDAGATEAELHGYGAVIDSFEILGLHRLSTVRAGDRGECSGVRHSRLQYYRGRSPRTVVRIKCRRSFV